MNINGIMFCKNCGAEIPDDSKHCKECGANIAEESSKDITVQNEEKKSIRDRINKKHVIGCVIGLIIIFILMGGLSNNTDTTSSTTTAMKNMSEQDFKANCTSVDYALLEKNPDKYKDQNLFFKGKIYQIQENNGEGMILLSTGSYNTDLVYVDYSGENNFVEGDSVTIYGVFKGDKSYNTRMGTNNLPYLESLYIDKS